MPAQHTKIREIPTPTGHVFGERNVLVAGEGQTEGTRWDGGLQYWSSRRSPGSCLPLAGSRESHPLLRRLGPHPRFPCFVCWTSPQATKKKKKKLEAVHVGNVKCELGTWEITGRWTSGYQYSLSLTLKKKKPTKNPTQKKTLYIF